MTTTTFTRIAVTALAGLLLAGCAAEASEPKEPVAAATEIASAPAETKAPATEETTAPEAPPDPSLEVTIDGVTYTGTEEAPLKIGDDTPGQAPAAEATFPAGSEDGGVAQLAAGKALVDEKYLVIVSPTYASDDPAGQGPVVGYKWGTYALNAHGSFKPMTGHGWHSNRLGYTDPYPTQQAAIDAPKTLYGRELDRSEYVLMFW